MIPRKPEPPSNEELEKLKNPANWTEEKTWIIPLRVTIMVDNPTKYDAQMNTLVNRILNELRGICKNFDRTGRQLFIEPGDIVKDPAQWDTVSNNEEANKTLEDKVADMVAKALAQQKNNNENS